MPANRSAGPSCAAFHQGRRPWAPARGRSIRRWFRAAGRPARWRARGPRRAARERARPGARARFLPPARAQARGDRDDVERLLSGERGAQLSRATRLIGKGPAGAAEAEEASTTAVRGRVLVVGLRRRRQDVNRAAARGAREARARATAPRRAPRASCVAPPPGRAPARSPAAAPISPPGGARARSRAVLLSPAAHRGRYAPDLRRSSDEVTVDLCAPVLPGPTARFELHQLRLETSGAHRRRFVFDAVDRPAARASARRGSTPRRPCTPARRVRRRRAGGRRRRRARAARRRRDGLGERGRRHHLCDRPVRSLPLSGERDRAARARARARSAFSRVVPHPLSARARARRRSRENAPASLSPPPLSVALARSLGRSLSRARLRAFGRRAAAARARRDPRARGGARARARAQAGRARRARRAGPVRRGRARAARGRPARAGSRRRCARARAHAWVAATSRRRRPAARRVEGGPAATRASRARTSTSPARQPQFRKPSADHGLNFYGRPRWRVSRQLAFVASCVARECWSSRSHPANRSSHAPDEDEQGLRAIGRGVGWRGGSK